MSKLSYSERFGKDRMKDIKKCPKIQYFQALPQYTYSVIFHKKIQIYHIYILTNISVHLLNHYNIPADCKQPLYLQYHLTIIKSHAILILDIKQMLDPRLLGKISS